MAADTTALTPADAHAHAAPDAHGSGGIGNPVLGMLLFITSEVMFFAGLFAAYFSIRAAFVDTDGVHRWPPQQFADILNPFQLQTESGALNVILPATILLVISLVHLPVRGVGDPEGQPDGVPAQHGGDRGPGHHVPAAPDVRLHRAVPRGPHDGLDARSARRTSRSPASTAPTSSAAS